MSKNNFDTYAARFWQFAGETMGKAREGDPLSIVIILLAGLFILALIF